MSHHTVATAQAVLSSTRSVLAETKRLADEPVQNNGPDLRDRLVRLAVAHTERAIRLYEALPWATLADDLHCTADNPRDVDNEDDAAYIIVVATQHLAHARLRLIRTHSDGKPEPSAISDITQAELLRHADRVFSATLIGLGVPS